MLIHCTLLVFERWYKSMVLVAQLLFYQMSFGSSRRQAPVAAVFAGSPQLMGVIKLCTGWTVTSLPLYSDDDLLKRNENVRHFISTFGSYKITLQFNLFCAGTCFLIASKIQFSNSPQFLKVVVRLK